MVGGGVVSEKKKQYAQKLKELLDEYPKILIVLADNVGSSQMQKIRVSLRGKAVVLMGKNTLMRKVVRGLIETNKDLEALLPLIKQNIGFVFTKVELSAIRNKLLENRVGAPAKAGIVAPNDVTVPAGPTGMEPTQTSFLQALNIASKINRGQVEIINDVFLIKKGDKVGTSEASLLAKLNIRPFSYGLQVVNVYDNGSVYDPSVLDLSDEDILNKFRAGVSRIASLSLELGFPTMASLPHSLSSAYKNVLSIALETEFNFPEAQKIKDILANPGAFAAAAPAAAAPAAAAAGGKPKPAEKAPEPEPEDDDDMFGGGGLFGDD